MVDDGAIADETPKAQIAFQQRRHLRLRQLGVDVLFLHGVHGHVASVQRSGTELFRCAVEMVQVGQHAFGFFRVGAMNGAATEHHLYVVAEDVVRDSAPQQLHGAAAPILSVDTRTAEFHNLSWIGQQSGEIELVFRIEASRIHGDRSTKQAVGADRAGRARTAMLKIDNQQVVANLVVGIHIAREVAASRRRLGTHLFVKDLVAERLSRIDINRAFRQAHFEGIEPHRFHGVHTFLYEKDLPPCGIAALQNCGTSVTS